MVGFRKVIANWLGQSEKQSGHTTPPPHQPKRRQKHTGPPPYPPGIPQGRINSPLPVPTGASESQRYPQDSEVSAYYTAYSGSPTRNFADSLAIPTINYPSSDPGSHALMPPPRQSPFIYILSVPENEQRALSSLSTQCLLSLAQVTAELAPVPSIGLLVESLTLVFQAIEYARINKEQWKLLRGRCVMVMRIAGAQVTNYGQHHYPGLENAAQALGQTLARIATRAQVYNTMNEIVALIQFETMSEEIRMLFSELDACLGLFSYTTSVAQAQWLKDFEAVQGQEMMELKCVRDLLSSMNSNLEGINQTQEHLVAAFDLIKEELAKQFVILQNPATATVRSYTDAQRIIRTILAVTRLHLPPELLVGNQCNFHITAPTKMGTTCAIYLANFLGREKVVKKVFSLELSDRDSVKLYAERFLTIANLWREFRSDYILPFYGIGTESFKGDLEFQLYMVSPLMENSDAVTYLKKHRQNAGIKQGILRIITDAALGLQYLHSRSPPVIHSGMRGDNILITNSGGAVLGGFGLTKAFESEGGNRIPPAVMTGRTESQRWMAPELLVGDNPPRLQTSSDVWGWAMAALEIVSGVIPYHLHKQALTVMHKIHQGHPRRKDYVKFEDYAYQPDKLWELFEECWAHEPGKRPTMDYVVTRLKEIAGVLQHSQTHKDKVNQRDADRKPPETLRSEGMSAQDMLNRLTQHGCLDLTLHIDLSATSEHPVAAGGFGDVWKARLRGDDNTEVAIKVWRIHDASEDGVKNLKASLGKAMRELYNWSKTNHENVHRLLGVMMFRGRLGMVSKWMHNGDLRRYIKRNTSVERYQLCVQATRAVQYLHENGMVHGDIKASNFLVSSEGLAKLTDFDHSIISDCSLMFSETTNKGGGTLRWMAPELVLESGHRSKQADIYALGMTLLEILTGNLPFYPQCSQDHQIFMALSTKSLPCRSTEFESRRGGRMWTLLVRCWDHDPTQRPTADEVHVLLESLIAETADSGDDVSLVEPNVNI